MIGGRCQASAECKVRSNISVYCATGTCVCPYNYHPNYDGTDCLHSSCKFKNNNLFSLISLEVFSPILYFFLEIECQS